jgi:hypothetical protein
MEVEVALRVVLLFAFDNYPIGLDFSVFSNRGFAIAPLLADTDVLPDGHASVHGRVLSALGTYPEILGEY